ncbi:hypothetical protein BDK92_0894 [Micromonospora pisi]|uniref:AbrB family looped-hinge helix DNA binding protein n=1 Tax=Micromonospora pisi TaxID=589240 RepID=A0A495JCB9_9ACTN|nr:hypothetical protein BDK92_0894 [Micromonospora pisi]
MPRLMAARERSSTYGFAAIDDRGRIAARLIFGALGWVPGTTVACRERGGLVVVSADRGGPIRVSLKGHLRLPAPVRRWCGLEAGSRVLLVADPDMGRLVVHPPAALDAMISRYYADVFGGDAV